MIELELHCPRCSYHYYLRLLRWYALETCPLCGNQAPVWEFKKAESTEGLKEAQDVSHIRE